MVSAVAACGAGDPDEVAAGVGDEEEALGRRAEAEIDKVLAGARGGAGDDGEAGGLAAVEGGEALGVGGEGLGGGLKWVSVEEWEFEGVGGDGLGGGEIWEEKEERENEREERESVGEMVPQRKLKSIVIAGKEIQKKNPMTSCQWIQRILFPGFCMICCKKK